MRRNAGFYHSVGEADVFYFGREQTIKPMKIFLEEAKKEWLGGL